VSGAIALLWSLVPDATSTEVASAVTRGARRRAVTPPLLHAAAALDALEAVVPNPRRRA